MQCLLMLYMLALGALTQLVWARGTFFFLVPSYASLTYIYSPCLALGETEM